MRSAPTAPASRSPGTESAPAVRQPHPSRAIPVTGAVFICGEEDAGRIGPETVGGGKRAGGEINTAELVTAVGIAGPERKKQAGARETDRDTRSRPACERHGRAGIAEPGHRDTPEREAQTKAQKQSEAPDTGRGGDRRDRSARATPRCEEQAGRKSPGRSAGVRHVRGGQDRGSWGERQPGARGGPGAGRVGKDGNRRAEAPEAISGGNRRTGLRKTDRGAGGGPVREADPGAGGGPGHRRRAGTGN